VATREEEIVLPERLDGVDIQAGLANLNGNRKLYKKILGDVFSRFHDVVPRLQGELAQGGRDEARRLIHTFKGVSGTLGAREAQKLSGQLEEALVDGALERVELLMPVWIPVVERVMTALAGVGTPVMGEEAARQGRVAGDFRPIGRFD
ncbi:MAG: Hpt domain-containing protein, partial [Magnetococcus sp. YQC-9]